MKYCESNVIFIWKIDSLSEIRNQFTCIFGLFIMLQELMLLYENKYTQWLYYVF